MAHPSLLTIAIDQLTVGMFVTKLDISWIDSPFMSHSRLIKSQEEIAALFEAGVKTLVIDTQKGAQPQTQMSATQVDEELELNPTEQDSVNEQVDESIAIAPETPVPPKPSIRQEMNAARVLRSQIKKAVNQLQDAFENKKKIQVEELGPLIDDTISSLERNDQALMSLVHLSRKSQKLADHCFGTFCLVLNLTKDQDIAEHEREQLGLAALMHEAGWSHLPLNLMGKRTSYSPKEKALVHKHVALAAPILAVSKLPELTLRIIREHHELLDGSGYPAGLTQAQQHRLTGYLTVVDAYEERVHQLLDSPGMLPYKALRSLYQDAQNGLYCAEIVANLISMLGIFPVCSAVTLSTGEKAIVQEFHKDQPLSPTVKIIYDAKGALLEEPIVSDLRSSADNPVHIEAAIDAHNSQVDPYDRLQVNEYDLTA